MHEPIKLPSIETRRSWIVATVVLLILALSVGAPWITVVALKLIATETGGLRSVPALAASLAWIGYGAGGILMGQIAERTGVRFTVILGAVMICIGLALSTGGATQLGCQIPLSPIATANRDKTPHKPDTGASASGPRGQEAG